MFVNELAEFLARECKGSNGLVRSKSDDLRNELRRQLLDVKNDIV